MVLYTHHNYSLKEFRNAMYDYSKDFSSAAYKVMYEYYNDLVPIDYEFNGDYFARHWTEYKEAELIAEFGFLAKSKIKILHELSMDSSYKVYKVRHKNDYFGDGTRLTYLILNDVEYNT